MKIFVAFIFISLLGCSLDPRYQTALENYAKDNCTGKLLSVSKLTIDGTIGSTMTYQCVEDTGVKTYSIKISDIPQKYWEIE